MDKIRYTGIKALTFSSIMSATSLVFVLITYFLSGSGILLVLILPLIASLVALKVNFKYALIYIIATVAMSFIDFQLQLFVILPSLISGIIFGYLIRSSVQGYYIIFLISVLNTGMQIGGTYLIRLIYQVDLINVYSSFFKINYDTFNNVYYLFLFTLSLIQTVITYIIMANEIQKIGFEFNENKNHYLWIYLGELGLSSLSVGINFINPSLAYVLIGFSLYFGVVLGVYHFSYYQKKVMLIVQNVLYAISIILIFVLSTVINNELKPLLILILIGSELISGLIIIINSKLIKKEKLDSQLFDKKD
jgi:hypothetical protein